jgi:hypothetical protein
VFGGAIHGESVDNLVANNTAKIRIIYYDVKGFY